MSALPRGDQSPRLAVVLVGAALALLASLSIAQARIEQAPNSRVLLDLPAGYVPSAQFAGFQHEGTGSSFVILEVPAKAYDELAAGLTPEKLAVRGIHDVTRGKLTRTDEHVFMRGRQKSPAGEFEKFFVLFKAADLGVLVSANVPAGAIADGSVKAEDVERSLASAAVTDTKVVRDLYVLSYLGPFKEAGAFVGTSKLYTLDGKTEPERTGALRATFIVAPSLDVRPIPDIADFATRLIETIAGYTGVKAGAARKATVAGLDGVILEAEARHQPDGRAVVIQQVVLAGKDGGYYRMVGIAPAEEADRLVPEFRKMAASFRLAE